MIDDDQEFLRDLLQTFREDAEERIKLLSQAVVELEAAAEGQAPAGSDAALAPIEVLYRETHSLKGAAGAVEQVQMEVICQNMESLLAALKTGELQPTPPIVDTLSESVDCLHSSLLAEPGADERTKELVDRLSALVTPGSKKPARRPAQKQAQKAVKETAQKPAQKPAKTPSPASRAGKKTGEGKTPPEPAAKPSFLAEPTPLEEEGQQANRATDTGTTGDSVRVSTAKLEALMRQAEEFISIKLATSQRSSLLRDVSSRLELWKQELHRARTSSDQTKVEEFLDWNSTLADGLLADIRMLAKTADDERRAVGHMVDELLDGMKHVLMLPVSSLLSNFPKMVRDLARAGKKQVELLVTGAEIEVDKRVIENLKDPLIHIVRNSVDHGIETPDVRQKLGKAARGRISIAVRQLENNKIELDITDNGAGLDMEKLRAAVQRAGLRTQRQLTNMDDSQVLQLAFASGISTSDEVSTVSGRGLGLAIVEQKVKQLGGSVIVETESGLGTLFRIHVPATLATARGILAEISDRVFVIPVVGVDRVVQVRQDEIRMIENRETIQIEGRTLPLVSLHEVLELPRKPQRDHSEHVQAVVVGSGDERVGFAVDRVLEEQEVLVKTLGPQLTRVRNVGGATVIGSGQVVPILNVVDLLHSAATRPMRGRRATVDQADGAARKAVLVVEDSITSRMLLKNVLEAAGYYVRPTVDGVDALAALREEEFDLVVSDIEMPRMDGFELTKKIRGDQRSARMPVVLVTALESQADRERGLDAGANAYLPKSSFTQGTLLKTVRSLM